MDFKDRLKEARLAKGLKQKELADSIGGITGNTISNYEKGISSPSVDVLQKLFDVLEITPNYVFQDSFNSNYNEKLTMKELALLKKYRSLDQYGKEAANSIIDVEHTRCTSVATEIEAAKRNTRLIPLAYVSLSAGKGNCLITNDYDTIEIDDDKFPDADVAFKIDGDSMEPQYSSGDIVYIHRQPSINPGEIGAFLYQDNQYMKKLIFEDGIYKLRSLNKNYNDIEIKDEITIYGKVLN